MNKFTIAMIVVVTSTFFTIAKCGAMPFTVDNRSAMHAGAGLALGYPLGVMAAHAQKTNAFSDVQAVLIAGTLAYVPLAIKEFAIDGHPDAGDLLFNLTTYVGAYLGVKTGHYFFVSQKDDTPMLNYVVRIDL